MARDDEDENGDGGGNGYGYGGSQPASQPAKPRQGAYHLSFDNYHFTLIASISKQLMIFAACVAR